MVEVIFRDSTIQTGYRIKIPKAVVDTLNLKKGSKIVIKFDAKKRNLVIEEEKKRK